MREPTRRRRGTAAVEFAVVLPLLLALVLGCVDFGRFAHSYIALTNAARAGAGFGGSHPYTPATLATWQDQVRQAVADELSSLNGFDPNRLTVTASAVGTGAGDWQAAVTVAYPFQTLVSWPGVPASVTLRRSVVMRATRP